MPEVQLRLEVWRPARPDRPLIYDDPDRSSQRISKLQEEQLHEQIYGWKLAGDVWTSLGANNEASAIKEKLTTHFTSNLPPEQRELNRMRSILEELKDYLAHENNRPWQSWEQLIEEDDPDSTYQVQPLLSFYHHLRWLCDVFQDLPGASVTIR